MCAGNGTREPCAPRTRHAAAPRRVRITGPIPDPESHPGRIRAVSGKRIRALSGPYPESVSGPYPGRIRKADPGRIRAVSGKRIRRAISLARVLARTHEQARSHTHSHAHARADAHTWPYSREHGSVRGSLTPGPTHTLAHARAHTGTHGVRVCAAHEGHVPHSQRTYWHTHVHTLKGTRTHCRIRAVSGKRIRTRVAYVGPVPRAQTCQAADGDRNAELSNANKSFADHRVTGDPPSSSPGRRAASTQILESTNNHKPYFIKHRTGFYLLGYISDVHMAHAAYVGPVHTRQCEVGPRDQSVPS
jgi:hypothetical protein